MAGRWRLGCAAFILEAREDDDSLGELGLGLLHEEGQRVWVELEVETGAVRGAKGESC